MALTQRSRTALYQGLTQLIQDDQAVEEMLSYFPSRDVEEPVTKEFVRAEFATVRAEIAELRGELHSEISGLRGELHSEISRLRGELHSEISGLHSEISGLRDELRTEISGLRAEHAGLRSELDTQVSGLRAEMHAGFRRMTVTVYTSMVTTAGVVIAANAAL